MKNTLRLILFIFFATSSVPDSEAQIIVTIAGNGSSGYSGDGAAATLATLYAPTCVTADNNGNIYINDQGNNAIRKINRQNGVITTIAGDGAPAFGGDGGPATDAKLKGNWGVVTDQQNNIYITDQRNFRVREIDVSGIINTIGGTGSPADSGDGGPALAADAGNPLGIAVDRFGNVYFCDNSKNVVREINTAGIITRVAGDGTNGYYGDGFPATNARLSNIFGLAVDAADNLYICDAGNNCVRKVNTSGIISTVAGVYPNSGYNGDNILATTAFLYHPSGVYVDGGGNMYIADSYNDRIRKVNTSGIITTIAGIGTPGFSGDNSMAIAAELDTPACVVMDSFENIYIADLGNERIREIYRDLYFNRGHTASVTACQNFSSYSTPVDSVLAATDRIPGLTVTWTAVLGPLHGSLSAPASAPSNHGTLVPSGLNYTPDLTYTGNDTFTVEINDGVETNFITVYVSVIPLPTYGGVINGPSYVCVGSSITLYNAVADGTWSITNQDAVVSDGVVKGRSPGTDTVEYSISNSCGSVTVSKTVAIDALPDAGVITGASAICIGSRSIYDDAVSGGTWSSRSPHAVMSPSGTDTAFTSGSDTIFYKVSDAFCTDSISFIVAIDSFPFAHISPTDTTVCLGAAITLADTPAGGIWTLSNGNATDSQTVVTTVLPGPETVAYSVTNACGTASALANITIDSLPVVPTVTQNGSIISVPSDYYGYQWLFNGSAIPGSTVDTYLVANTGQYSVYVKNKYGCSTVSPPIFCKGCTPADIVVYPNPTESMVYVKWCKNLIIRIISDDGRSLELLNDINQADLSNLPDADYLIVLYDLNGNKIKTEKISKMTR